eukprot:TRINITY_DN7884_c0_g1_i8.p1 TRINITY_DN7884_c0_g1~~TRINITY_DN7884_c0_g1_i8.p1  ORF type:complete len:555 (+),score=91.53 TRINITY_DN7884_c0_g1_i8:68-1732(+)
MLRGVVHPTVDSRHVAGISDVDRHVSQVKPRYGRRYRDEPHGIFGGALGPDPAKAVLRACDKLGRPQDASRVLQYLEEEWLLGCEGLASLTEAGWQQLSLPIGLKEELRRQLQISDRIGNRRPHSAAATVSRRHLAGPGSSPSWYRDHDVDRNYALQEFDFNSPLGRSREFLHEEEGRANAVVDRLRQFVNKAGPVGIRGLGKKFQIMDSDKSGQLSRLEFQDALQRVLHDFRIDPDEVQLLWDKLDEDRSGFIDMSEFVLLLKGGLNARRRQAVQKCFQILDQNGDGVLALDDLKLRYDPSPLSEPSPHLVMGPRPPEEVLQKFLDSLRRTINGSPYAEIRLREFEKYYDRISANIDSDEFFNEMLERAWNLPPGWMGAASAASRRVGNRGSRESGKQILSRLRAALTRKKLSFDDDRLAEVVRSGSSRFRDVVRGAMNRGLAGSDAARNADTLARALQEYWPELSDKDVRILGAIFQTDDGDFDMEYFAEELGLSAADRSSSRADARREAILRVYQDLTGSAEDIVVCQSGVFQLTHDARGSMECMLIPHCA